jgi:cytochrome d ubiquinol oxidase subunit II
VASLLWPVQVLLTIFSLVATVWVVPNALGNYSKWRVGYVVPVVVFGSLGYLFFAHSRGKERGAFIASCAYIVGMLVGAAFALYPNVLPASTGAERSLTIYNTAAGAHGLGVGFVWWTLGMLLALGYFVFVYRMFRGKVRLEGSSEHGY